MKAFFFTAINLLLLNCLYSQVVVPSDYDEHWVKRYMRPNGEEVSVSVYNLDYESKLQKVRNTVIKNQADLVLQKEYFESGKIKSIGYFRLIYITEDKNYGWQPDLLWTYYDENGTLKGQELFCNGILVKE